MSLRFNSKAVSVEKLGPERCLVQLEDSRQIVAEMVLFAAGRTGATATLNLEAAGLAADERGRIARRSRRRSAPACRTSTPWAT